MYKKRHIHFIGIGGIGMSGIATILKNQGYDVSGCDADIEQQSIKNLAALGCSIYHGNNNPACNQPAIDVVVYSSAIQLDHPEIAQALQRNIPVIPRALMLAELMRTKYSVAIAGSHGKTTTTSLIAHILIEAGIDPTVIIGGHLKTLSSNALLGQGAFLVAEADESDRSFLHLHATFAVVTNINFEHVDTYHDLDDVKNTFVQFINRIPFYGKAFLCIDDPHVRSILPQNHVKKITYGLSADADIRGAAVNLQSHSSSFTVYDKEKELGSVTIQLLGIHNVLNSLGAIAFALDLDIPFATIAQALGSFKGVERRFSYRGTFQNAEIFDDYGHHPVEIAHTLNAARLRAKNGLTVVFQPHRFTRTQRLWHQFLDVFEKSSVNNLIITDIYDASEQPIPDITSKRLVEDLHTRKCAMPITYIPYEQNFASIKQFLQNIVQPDDLILVLGAGKIHLLAHQLKEV